VELADLDRWLDKYGRAWERGDAEASIGLYSEDVRYYETPFDAPEIGHESVRRYCLEAAGAQRDVRFSHEAYSMEGDTGIARWRASFVRVPSGMHVELDGIFVLRFDGDGKCRELREWWHRAETEGEKN
jgi:ketosteroid isomerase-like protein